MRIRDVMQKKVTALHCELPITELEKLLLDEHISGVPVVSASGEPDDEVGVVARKMVQSRFHRVIVTDSDDKIVGIVSSLDIVRVVGSVG